MWYEREFPDFDESLRYIYASLNVPETWDYRTQGEAFQRWVDCSWHNDSCPRFSYAIGAPYDSDMNLDLFVDYVDPAKSQDPESRADGGIKRYQLYNEQACRVIFATDAWDDMLYFIKGFTDALTTACVALAEVDIKSAMLYKAQTRPIVPYYAKVHHVRSEHCLDAIAYR